MNETPNKNTPTVGIHLYTMVKPGSCTKHTAMQAFQ
jgi:hypothetical protein